MPDGDELSDVRHDGPVFAGGRSVRDYRVFFEAMAEVTVPCVVSAPSSALPEGVPVPPWVEVGELDAGCLRPGAAGRERRRRALAAPGGPRRRPEHLPDRDGPGQARRSSSTASPSASTSVDGVTGLVVDADPAALAAALRWALDPVNAAEVAAIRSAARLARHHPLLPGGPHQSAARDHPRPARHRRTPRRARGSAHRAAESRPVGATGVAMVEFPPSGGLFQFSVQLGEALARRGHRVDVITGPRPELRSREAACRVRGVLPTWHPHAGFRSHRPAAPGPSGRPGRCGTWRRGSSWPACWRSAVPTS